MRYLLFSSSAALHESYEAAEVVVWSDSQLLKLNKKENIATRTQYISSVMASSLMTLAILILHNSIYSAQVVYSFANKDEINTDNISGKNINTTQLNLYRKHRAFFTPLFPSSMPQDM